MDFLILVEWRDIAGYGGAYSISSTGEVRSNARKGARGRILKQIVSRNGYMTVTLSSGGVCKVFKVHSLVATAFLGPRPAGLDICHYDDNKANNNVSNLRYDTRSANVADSVRNGTHVSAGKTKSECKRGHLYTPENTYINGRGVKSCRECRNKAQREYNARRMESVS